MTNTKNGSNQGMVPEARAAMDQFKMEAASEVGVNLKQGYNGDLTSRQAGSIGGQMVKKMCPVHTSSFEELPDCGRALCKDSLHRRMDVRACVSDSASLSNSSFMVFSMLPRTNSLIGVRFVIAIYK